MSVAVGDKVLVPEYGGTKLTFDNEVRVIFSLMPSQLLSTWVQSCMVSVCCVNNSHISLCRIMCY